MNKYTLEELRTVSESELRGLPERIDWNKLSMIRKLSEDYVEEFSDQLNWDHLSLCHSWSPGFYVSMADYFNWSLVTTRHETDEQFLERFSDRIDWNAVRCHGKSLEFLDRWIDRLMISELSQCDLTDSFIIRHASKLRWDLLCRVRPLTDEVVASCLLWIDWSALSEPENWYAYPDEFFDRWYEWLDWESLSVRRFSLPVLKNHQNRINWQLQSLVIPFIPEYLISFKERLNWSFIVNRPDFTEDIDRELAKSEELIPLIKPVPIDPEVKKENDTIFYHALGGFDENAWLDDVE